METNIIRNTMIAGLGFVLSNSATSSPICMMSPEIEFHTTIKSFVSSSSTRFNNSTRFSLEQLKINKRKLESFKNYKINWNGYNGHTFDDNLILQIENIISKLEYQPQIFPTGRGSIQIEKFINEKNLVEIEISNDEVFAYIVKNGNEEEKEISISDINKIITELYA